MPADPRRTRLAPADGATNAPDVPAQADAPDAAAAPSVALLHDRALGAYLGLALGDALGATVEFMTPREIAQRHGVHRDIIGGGWLRLPAGQVTDDTTMSLALGEALRQGAAAGTPGDATLMAQAFASWLRARPVDCGNTCRRGIQRWLSQGTLQGPPHEGDAGNGALMRNLPVVLATLWDAAAFERWSLLQARITHHHPLSDAAVLGYGQLLRSALLHGDAARVCVLAQQWVRQQPAFAWQPYPRRASAYVVDTVQTVLHHGLQAPDFEAALVATVNQGDDADTTGALVGMLRGALCGASALPLRWLQRLQPSVRAQITEQASALLALALRLRPPAAASAASSLGAEPDAAAGLAGLAA